jgi:hypothetical protein
MSQAQLQNQVQAAVLSKAMETEEAQGEAMAEMIRASEAPQRSMMSDPAKGQKVNILA